VYVDREFSSAVDWRMALPSLLTTSTRSGDGEGEGAAGAQAATPSMAKIRAGDRMSGAVKVKRG